MEASQSFRAKGSTDIEKIPCNQINGMQVLYWEDIEEVFPGIQHLKHGDTTVTKLRDSAGKRIEPLCIKYYPGAVLDVVLHTTLGSDSVESQPSTRIQTDDSAQPQSSMATTDDIVEGLQVGHLPEDSSNSNDILRTLLCASTPQPQSLISGDKAVSKVGLSFKQVVKLAQKKLIESEVEQRLVSSLPSNLQVQVRASANIHDALVQAIKGGQVDRPNEELAARLQELKDMMAKNTELTSTIVDLVTKINEMTLENNGLSHRVIELQGTLEVKQDEMKQLQTQALDQLALLQNNVKAILTQTYELHEYPIPRLFIVLPADSSSWNPMNLFANKFRLYFLCECGEHTKSTNSKIPHHIHLAKHEGYDVTRPKEFFHQYGSYILTILRMLKFGISVAGVAVPALSLLIHDDAIQKASSSLKSLVGNIQSGVDQVIGCIEGVAEDEEVLDGQLDQMENNEALEGADLRQLETFLKDKDENRVLGNLYRTVTTEGHVKWVCLDHYRENYHEKAMKAFQDTMSTLGGSFNENIGRAEVMLGSRLQSDQFYGALEKAKSVYELKIGLNWAKSKSDFKRLRDTLVKTNVGILELDLHSLGDFALDIDLYNKLSPKFDPIFDIMRHRSIQSVAIVGLPEDFIKRSSLQSRKDQFLNLKHLSVDMEGLNIDKSSLKHLVAKTPNLSSLTLKNELAYREIYLEIAEYQTYPISFTRSSINIPPPKRESKQPMSPHHYLIHLWKSHGHMILGTELDELAMDALAKDTQDVSSLKELHLYTHLWMSDSFIKNIASVVAHTELLTIEFQTGDDERRVHILESIQWEHVRDLELKMKSGGSLEAPAIRALVSCAGRMALDGFCIRPNSYDAALSMSHDELLSAFLSSTPLGRLQLYVVMTLEQMLSLLRSVDFSKMWRLGLWAAGFDSDSVDLILDSVQHATELKCIDLWHATVTDEQERRMGAKGIKLSAEIY